MKKYQLSKDTIAGVITVGYLNGRLELIDTSEAQLTEKQHEILFGRVPVDEDKLPAFCDWLKVVCIEVNEVISFEDFYQMYGVKEGRKKAEAIWAKMPKAEQFKAYRYTQRLKAKKSHSGEAMPYPATYLNQKRWND